ncbi:MAG TPA: FG-GAP-like repeat-containing protein [Phycicoccus sp.]
MSIRTRVAAVVAAAVAVVGRGPAAAQAASAPFDATAASDWSGDGRADIALPTRDGKLWLYRGDGAGGFVPGRTQIGSGWNSRDQIRMVGDWDGLPGTDIISRDVRNGDLWLYSGNGSGGFRSWKRISTRWLGFSHIFSPGDWDGDGHNDLLAIVKSTGELRLYRGNGAGGFLGQRVISTGWQRYDGLMMTGDFDGNGLPDFLARNTVTGDLRLYRGNGSGGFQSTIRVGGGWLAFTAMLGVGDWSGDGHSDVVARLSDGRLRLFPGNGAGGWLAEYPIIGSGWNSIRFPGETSTVATNVATGTVCTNPYVTLTGSNDGVSNGGYYVHNNLWNASGYPGTKGTTQVCSYRSWNHIGTATNTGDGAVKTYPNVHKDYSGRTVSSFSRLTSSFAATSPNVGIYNVAYDIWLNGVPNDELMIWTDNRKQYPAGSKVASNLSLSGYTWDLYATSGNGYLAFVPSNGVRITAGTIDIKAMLNYLVSKGRVASNATVDQICYGVEIVDTGGQPATWRFTNFSISD